MPLKRCHRSPPIFETSIPFGPAAMHACVPGTHTTTDRSPLGLTDSSEERPHHHLPIVSVIADVLTRNSNSRLRPWSAKPFPPLPRTRGTRLQLSLDK